MTTNPKTLVACAAGILLMPALSIAQTTAPAVQPRASAPMNIPLRPCQSVSTDEPINVTLGKSRVVRLPFPAVRIVVGGRGTGAGRAGAPVVVPQGAAAPGRTTGASQSDSDGVAETDITLISPTELYVLGRRPGAMNVVVQAADGRCLVKDIVVTVDAASLQGTITEFLPDERDVRVRATEGALVLSGTVTDTIRMDEVLSIASSYAGEQRRIINLLKVSAPQQVMLEVTIAEVSKTILDHLNLDFARMFTTADGRVSRMLSGIIGGGPATFSRFSRNLAGGAVNNGAAASVGTGVGAAASSISSASTGATLLGVDAQQRDGIVRVLAEPNILAISGQSASFLSGGKIFIPVAQNRDNAGTTITLQEKEFGVGLKFTPTVLDGARINLKLVSEVSELQQTGSPFTSINGLTAILPSMATRRVDTTVQLRDGQSFMVAGLIKNNVTGALDKFPGLGQAPVVGALFRSTEFQNDQTELMFIVTPRLVKPLQGGAILPTDNHIAPTRNDVILKGTAEGTRRLAPAPTSQAAPVVDAPAAVPYLPSPAVPAAPENAAPPPSGEPAPAAVERSS